MRFTSKFASSILVSFYLLTFSCNQSQQKTETTTVATTATDGFDRTVLPMVPPALEPFTEEDARKAKAPAPWEVKAPKGAPNVILVLVDDFGFGMSNAFGGPINMPFADKLAASGLRYNRFHTTALCSPTRTALLTGRNHHSNNMAGITEVVSGSPGYRPCVDESLYQCVLCIERPEKTSGGWI
jgi:arylsulfatase